MDMSYVHLSISIRRSFVHYRLIQSVKTFEYCENSGVTEPQEWTEKLVGLG